MTNTGRALIVLLCAVIARSDLAAAGNVLLDWNAAMTSAIRLDNSSPTLASRNLAIMHTAIYDAVNSITRTHQPYRFQVDTPPGTSEEGAVIGAAYEVLVALYPGSKAPADELYYTHTSALAGSASFSAGLTLGETVGQMILESRRGDGASTDVPYIPSALPGEWRRTPPFFRPPTSPGWGYVDYFGIPEDLDFVPKPYPALDSPQYAASLNEVKQLGAQSSTTRTAEQTLIARFWSDFSYTVTPPGHWQQIVADIARRQETTLEDCARLFALVSISQADAGIVSWQTKYRFNLWRPVTAVQRANEDNNPLTDADPSWNSLLAAPPFPSYMSGHSTFSKASSQILTAFYGTDSLNFSVVSDSVPGVTRAYSSVGQCADEIGMSRIYGGIHFGFDNFAGKNCGKMIADFVSANLLLPNSALPLARLEQTANGVARVRIHAAPGQRIVLEASDNLLNWQPISTNIAVLGGTVVSETSGSSLKARFYRVQR